jgi:ketosteroid isomerase-like protein
MRWTRVVAASAVVLASQAPSAQQMPSQKRLPTAQAVVDEHMDAINACDWMRVMAQYPEDVQFFLPGGQVVKGRAAVGDLFRGFLRPVKDRGLCGLKFTAEHVFVVGDTINVSWVANAGVMLALVTRFEGAAIKHMK